MVFIIKSDTRDKVRERINYIVGNVESQGRYDFSMYIRDIDDGLCVGSLWLRFHKKSYPSHYPPNPKNKPWIILDSPG